MSSSCNRQLRTAGFGKQFASPKRKTGTIVNLPNKELRQKSLLAKFKRLCNEMLIIEEPGIEASIGQDLADLGDPDVFMDSADTFTNPTTSVPSDTPSYPHQTLPNTESSRLFKSWSRLLNSLLEPFLAYANTSTGCIVTPANNLHSQCCDSACQLKSTPIQCLIMTMSLQGSSLDCS
jgi:hypothetical protein